MALPEDNAIFWNKQENAALISEIGPNGINVNATFPPGHWGNAALCNANNEYTRYNVLNNVNMDEFIIEKVINTEYDIVNGRPQDAAVHDLLGLLRTGGGATEFRYIFFDNAAFGMFISRDGVNTLCRDTTSDWVAGTDIHVMIVVSRSANFDGLKTLAIYINGIQTASSVEVLSNLGSLSMDIFCGARSDGLQPLDGWLDNPKIYNLPSAPLVAAIILNSVTNDVEGWPVPPPPIPVLEYIEEQKISILPRVLILSQGIDIYSKIDKLTKISERKTFRRDKLITNHIQQEVDNSNDVFSINNKSSIFHGYKWEFDKFIIEKRGKISWDGIIEDIERDHNRKKIKIFSTDKLFQFKDIKIDYKSEDWETPAMAWKNICDSIGFDYYDITSINASNDIYIDNNCYIKCNIKEADNITFQPLSEKLAEIGCADCFTHKNKAYFKHMSGGIGAQVINVELEPKDLLKQPVIKHLNLINSYRIGYEGSGLIPATDQNSDNIGQYSRAKYKAHDLPEFMTGDNSQIMFKDRVSAVYIGNCYLRRTHIDFNTGNPKRVQVMDTALKIQHEEWVNINTGFFSLSYPDESWNQKIWETVFSEINEDKNIIYIQAYEVEEL